jgi:hypothetical protein
MRMLVEEEEKLKKSASSCQGVFDANKKRYE